MRFSTLLLPIILPLTTLSSPTPSAETTLLFPPATPGSLPVLKSPTSLDTRSLAKRAVTGTVTASALKHRQCPHTDDKKCPADGQFSKGARIQIRCARGTDTSVVEGDP
jgi:hypothetical protein